MDRFLTTILLTAIGLVTIVITIVLIDMIIENGIRVLVFIPFAVTCYVVGRILNRLFHMGILDVEP